MIDLDIALKTVLIHIEGFKIAKLYQRESAGWLETPLRTPIEA